MVWGSPTCGPFSATQNINQNTPIIAKNLSLSDLRNEIEQITGEMISSKNNEYLNNVGFVRKTINAEIILQTKEKKQSNTIAKFESDVVIYAKQV